MRDNRKPFLVKRAMDTFLFYANTFPAGNYEKLEVISRNSEVIFQNITKLWYTLSALLAKKKKIT